MPSYVQHNQQQQRRHKLAVTAHTWLPRSQSTNSPYTSNRATHLSRPHKNELDVHASTGELIILLGCLFLLVALIGWLGWICVSHCVNFMKEKLDIEAQTKKTGRRVERVGEQSAKMGDALRRWLGRRTVHVYDDMAERVGLLDGGDDWTTGGMTRVGQMEDCEGQCGPYQRRPSVPEY